MSSTEYHVNRKELQFVVMEVLEAGKLCGFEDFSEFDEDLFSMTINEACTFAEQVLDPINQSGDREGCQVENGSVKTPQGFPEAWRKMGEGGWLAMNMPPDFGGMGLPELVTVAAKEVQLAANQSLCIGNTLTTGAANLIVNFGSDEQKEEYCEKMFNGTWSGTMCLTEPHAGSAVGDIITTAVQQPDGHYLIKGTKQFITTGDHDMSENIIHLLLARTEGAPDGTKGISLFIVPKFRKDGTQNDVTLVNIEKKMGLHASPTCVLSFGEKGDCHGYLLQAENKGMAQMFQMMNEARLFVGLQGLAGAGAACHNAVSYANERLQGPSPMNPGEKAKIVEHPDVRRMLMQMRSVTEGLRAMMYTVAWYTDMAHHGPEETREYYQDLVDLHIPVCKAFGTDQGFEVACTGIQVLGGVGFTRDFPLEQNARDQKIGSIYEGTNGIQAMDLVGRKFGVKQGALIDNLVKELNWFESNPPEDLLVDWVREWEGYRKLMFESISNLKRIGEHSGQSAYLLYAVNMLQLMGDVLCSFYLLKQAQVAKLKLNEMLPEGKDLRAYDDESEEAEFYWNKLKTAEYYVWSILPRVLSHERIIRNASLTPLEVNLSSEVLI